MPTSIRLIFQHLRYPSEDNYVAAAKLYKDQCAGCHGLPNQNPPPAISDTMFPHAPLLFKGTGVTDDPASESYWKAANGIRLTGMPSFKNILTETQLWQVAQLVATRRQSSGFGEAITCARPATGSSGCTGSCPCPNIGIEIVTIE